MERQDQVADEDGDEQRLEDELEPVQQVHNEHEQKHAERGDEQLLAKAAGVQTFVRG